MKLEQSFTVTAPVEQVWAMLVDVERVAPCLPGAEITGQTPDGGYEGTFSVKLGPATAAYRGALQMESLDEAARTATMKANGTDKRGQGGAHATIVSTMKQEGDETQVDVVTDFTITGRLARFGRGGMIEDISKRLMRDFAQCLQATLASEQAAGAVPPSSAAEQQAVAAEAATAAPLPGQESPAGDEPLQPAAAEPAAAEPPAAEPAEPPPSPAPGIAAEPGPLPGDTQPAGDPAAPAPPRAGSIPPPTASQPAPQPAKPVRGFSLLFGVLWDRIKTFFQRLFGRKN